MISYCSTLFFQTSYCAGHVGTRWPRRNTWCTYRVFAPSDDVTTRYWASKTSSYSCLKIRKVPCCFQAESGAAFCESSCRCCCRGRMTPLPPHDHRARPRRWQAPLLKFINSLISKKFSACDLCGACLCNCGQKHTHNTDTTVDNKSPIHTSYGFSQIGQTNCRWYFLQFVTIFSFVWYEWTLTWNLVLCRTTFWGDHREEGWCLQTWPGRKCLNLFTFITLSFNLGSFSRPNFAMARCSNSQFVSHKTPSMPRSCTYFPVYHCLLNVTRQTKSFLFSLHFQAVSAHTWFPGFSWRISVCPRCGVHLGWYVFQDFCAKICLIWCFVQIPFRSLQDFHASIEVYIGIFETKTANARKKGSIHLFVLMNRSFEPHDHQEGTLDTERTFIGLILDRLLHGDCEYLRVIDILESQFSGRTIPGAEFVLNAKVRSFGSGRLLPSPRSTSTAQSDITACRVKCWWFFAFNFRCRLLIDHSEVILQLTVHSKCCGEGTSQQVSEGFVGARSAHGFSAIYFCERVGKVIRFLTEVVARHELKCRSALCFITLVHQCSVLLHFAISTETEGHFSHFLSQQTKVTPHFMGHWKTSKTGKINKRSYAMSVHHNSRKERHNDPIPQETRECNKRTKALAGILVPTLYHVRV